ncbi:hypothetical protein [Novosphingobium sp.]|uniref:hypothetical protein n=1 Tax=Novosphingobium sp. TaxID=1874826 RepID=UPI003D0ED85B
MADRLRQENLLPMSLTQARERLHELLQNPSKTQTEQDIAALLQQALDNHLAPAAQLYLLQLRLKRHFIEDFGVLSEAEAAAFIRLEHAAATGATLAAEQTYPPVTQVELLPAPDLISTHGWYDWVLADNPHIPPAYFHHLPMALASPAFMQRAFLPLRGTVWLRLGCNALSDINTFAEHVLTHLVEPITLITTYGNNAIPGDLQPGVADKILNHPAVRAWYTQNYDGTQTHAKLLPVPIGLDATNGNMATLRSMQMQAPAWRDRRAMVLADVQHKTHPERAMMQAQLADCPHVEWLTTRLPFAAAMQKYGRYRFALSARGRGLDCYRTWELLLMKTIVIVKTSPLDALYKNLPVVIVSDWKAARDMHNLHRWSAQFADLLQQESSAWLDKARWVQRAP